MKKMLKNYAPIGISFKTVFGFIAFQYAMVLLSSTNFFGNLQNALWKQQELSIRTASIVQMESFAYLITKSFAVVPLAFIAIAVGLGVYQFAYHYKDSKSVYLMKRLPNKYEYFRRVMTIPIISALGVLVLVFVIVMTYYAVYIAKSPVGSVADGQLKLLFDVWFRGGKI